MNFKKCFSNNFPVLFLTSINIMVFTAINAFPNLRDVFL